MGVLRKGRFVTTGGLSGAVGIKANSKKERIAKALEAQNRPARVAPAVARDSGRQFTHLLGLFDFRKLSPEDKVACSRWCEEGANGRSSGRRNGRADDAMLVNGEVAGLSTPEALGGVIYRAPGNARHREPYRLGLQALSSLLP